MTLDTAHFQQPVIMSTLNHAAPYHHDNNTSGFRQKSFIHPLSLATAHVPQGGAQKSTQTRRRCTLSRNIAKR